MANKLQKIAITALLGLTVSCASNKHYTNNKDLYPDARTLHCASVKIESPDYNSIKEVNRMILEANEFTRVSPAPETD